MPAVFFLNIFFVFCVIIPTSSMASDADWDTVTGQNNQESSLEKTVTRDESLPDEQWPEFQSKWSEDKDRYTITVDITGIAKDKINIDVKENSVVLSANSKTGLHEKIDVGGNKFYRQEDEQLNWKKIIRVPEDAELKLMSHRFVDGDLRIVIPKKRLKSII